MLVVWIEKLPAEAIGGGGAGRDDGRDATPNERRLTRFNCVCPKATHALVELQPRKSWSWRTSFVKGSR